MTQVGNPEGEDKPNKKLLVLCARNLLITDMNPSYDPRVWCVAYPPLDYLDTDHTVGFAKAKKPCHREWQKG